MQQITNINMNTETWACHDISLKFVCICVTWNMLMGRLEFYTINEITLVIHNKSHCVWYCVIYDFWKLSLQHWWIASPWSLPSGYCHCCHPLSILSNQTPSWTNSKSEWLPAVNSVLLLPIPSLVRFPPNINTTYSGIPSTIWPVSCSLLRRSHPILGLYMD